MLWAMLPSAKFSTRLEIRLKAYLDHEPHRAFYGYVLGIAINIFIPSQAAACGNTPNRALERIANALDFPAPHAVLRNALRAL
jgi:hypothetical protein